MLELHDHALSAECYAVRLMLALVGSLYSRVTGDISSMGELPVLVDQHARIQGFVPCLLHLAGTIAPEWQPAPTRSAISNWLAFAEGDLAALAQARRSSVLGQPGNVDQLNRMGRSALRRLDDHLLDQRLKGENWVAAKDPTIADIAIFPPVMLSHDSGIGHEDYPAINLWQRRVRRLPGFVGMPGIPDYF